MRVTDEGVRSEGDQSCHRLRVLLDADSPPEQGHFFVVYVNVETGLVDRALGRLSAPFHSHPLLVAFWRDYREIHGFGWRTAA